MCLGNRQVRAPSELREAGRNRTVSTPRISELDFSHIHIDDTLRWPYAVSDETERKCLYSHRRRLYREDIFLPFRDSAHWHLLY